MNPCQANRHTQHGNVLFLILIAVALFAALSFAISYGLRSGDSNASAEQRSTAAAQILQYVTGLRSSVQRLVLNGCAENQLSFEPPPFSGSGAYFNPNSPTDFSCHVFHNNGGGQSPWFYQPQVQGQNVFGSFANPIYNGSWSVNRIGRNNRADLTVIFGITNGDLCRELNQRNGVNNPGGAPPARPGSHTHPAFNGSFTDPPAGWQEWSSVSGSSTLDPGHMEACHSYFDRGPNMHLFYAVLLPR